MTGHCIRWSPIDLLYKRFDHYLNPLNFLLSSPGKLVQLTMPEHIPHPLTRMVYIKNPVFWMFFAICATLYFYREITAGKHATNAGYFIYGDWAWVAAFIALLLTILADSSKRAGISRTINICCYTFEAISVIVLGMLILF